MRVGLDLNNRQEADAITRSLEDPVIKAATVISGMLLELPTVAQRRAVISVVATLTGFNGKALDDLSAQLRLHNAGDNGE